MSGQIMALTFEAGGDPSIAGRVLNVLRESAARATIFLDGAWSAQNADLVKRMSAEGHELGNHAYTHPDLTRIGDEEVREELRRTDALAQQLTGQRAHPWLRPPFGAFDARVRLLAAADGYRIVQRDAVDGGHWPGDNTPDSVLKRTLENAAPGAVIAYHLSSPLTLEALPAIIRDLRAAGYGLVRLSDLAHVTERAERHTDFAGVKVEPGYLQVMQRGARVWSLNLLEYGARANRPDGKREVIAQTDEATISLTMGVELDWQPASSVDRYLLVVAGALECTFRPAGEESPVARAVGRPYDLILWAAGCEARITPFGDSRRWIVMILPE